MTDARKFGILLRYSEERAIVPAVVGAGIDVRANKGRSPRCLTVKPLLNRRTKTERSAAARIRGLSH